MIKVRATHDGGTHGNAREGGQYSHGHINDVIGAGLLYILGGPRGGLVALVTKRDSGGGGGGSVIQ